MLRVKVLGTVLAVLAGGVRVTHYAYTLGARLQYLEHRILPTLS